MNDPQLFAQFLMLGALSWFLSRESARRSVVVPVALMALCGFYKHNIIAMPVAALAWVACRDWRRAMMPALAGAAVIAIGLLFVTVMYNDTRGGFEKLFGWIGRLFS